MISDAISPELVKRILRNRLMKEDINWELIGTNILYEFDIRGDALAYTFDIIEEYITSLLDSTNLASIHAA